MALHKFTATFQTFTELPEDSIVNTWWFEGGGGDPENVYDMLYDFYNVVPTGGTLGIGGYMSDDHFTGQVTIKGYNMATPEPRAPMFEQQFEMPVLSTAESLPGEVALVLSYHAQPVSGTPMARLRGRVYLGPFAENTNTQGRPISALRLDIARSARDMLQASNASTSWEWRQNSPTRVASSIVVGGWVDDSWDSQRRRGWQSTTRTTWTGGTP